ncbi:hypothetical protein C8J56DRAFT_92218 [Mycena floridula]|nr:hypothetical protein C8J56DRAFT_92218 [Mycena floridula]
MQDIHCAISALEFVTVELQQAVAHVRRLERSRDRLLDLIKGFKDTDNISSDWVDIESDAKKSKQIEESVDDDQTLKDAQETSSVFDLTATEPKVEDKPAIVQSLLPDDSIQEISETHTEQVQESTITELKLNWVDPCVPPESSHDAGDEGESRASSSASSNGRPRKLKLISKPGAHRRMTCFGPSQPDLPVKQKDRKYTIRIYRANGTYHVVSIGLQVTVAKLTPKLKGRLLMGKPAESYRLYFTENGEERVLAPTERPTDIVRLKLEAAGYDTADGMPEADVLLSLFKFVYKPTVRQEVHLFNPPLMECLAGRAPSFYSLVKNARELGELGRRLELVSFPCHGETGS